MSDNRKYYYLKLKENFFTDEKMVILESMEHVNQPQNFWTKSPEVKKWSFECTWERTKQSTRHSQSPN